MLTPEQKETYVKNRSGECPYCGCVDFDAGSFDMAGTCVAQRIECCGCGKAWNDVYTLTDIEEIDPSPLDAPGDACIQVEYDLEFWGGDYADCGDFAYIPVALVNQCGSVEAAFTKQTGHDKQHIIHYSPDEWYTPEGDLIGGNNIPYVGYYVVDEDGFAALYHTMYPNDFLGEFTDGRFMPSKFLLELPPECHQLADGWASNYIKEHPDLFD